MSSISIELTAFTFPRTVVLWFQKELPSLNPQTPAEISDAILLYHVNIPAYTYQLSDITTKEF